MTDPELDRRAMLALAGAGATSVLSGCGWRRGTVDWEAAETTTDAFESGWPDSWLTDGVANRTDGDGRALLEAGTDMYPASQRALAVRPDRRAVDTRIQATVTDSGIGPGVVARRTGPHQAYAAVLDAANGSFDLLVLDGVDERVLASRPVGLPAGEPTLELAAVGTEPTTLHGALHADTGGTLATVSATDDTGALQAAGDPGLLSTAESGLTPEPDPDPGALEQFRLLGVADGSIEYTELELPYDLSTTAFGRVEIASRTESGPTPPSVVAVSARRPTDEGFAVRVVSDTPATVAVETAPTAEFESPTRTDLGETNAFRAVLGTVPAPAGEQRYWRPVLERRGLTTRGPVRQVSVPPARGAPGEVSLAVGACASRFTSTFQEIAALDPDALVWEGDINYPDAMGPVAQTMAGYGGLWKALLRTPELAALMRSSFVAFSRDDHDYGQNDVASADLRPYGTAPYESVLESEPYYRFGGGPLDVWVLDTRKWRDDHDKPDDEDKTLLGPEQLDWLLGGLAESSAPFKLVCSPGPVFNVPNDSFSWARGFTAERERVLSTIEREVDGQVVFATGDTHSGCVTRDRGVLEVRAAPLEMPSPAWHAASSGDSVLFTDTGNFFTYVEATGTGTDATLAVSLRRTDGSVAWETELAADRA
jgi:hypothetical protein